MSGMNADIRQKIIVVTDTHELKNLIVQLGLAGQAGAAVGARTAVGAAKSKGAWSMMITQATRFGAALGVPVRSLGILAAGGIVAGISAIAFAFGKSAIEAAKFEQKFTEVTTLFDTATTSAAVMRKELITLSTQGPLKLLDLTQGLYDLLSAGVAAKDGMTVLNVAMKYAVGGATDADTAIDGLTSAMTAWSIAAEDMEAASDSFFVAVRNGKVTAKELADSIGNIAPIASAAGVSLDEALASVAAISNAGVRTSQAMTQVRSLLIAIMRQVPQTKKVAAEMGYDFSVAGLRAKGLHKFLQDLLVASKGNETQLTRLVGRIEALAAIMQLTGSQSDQFAQNLDDMTRKAGATQKAFDKMKETTISLYNQLMNNLYKVLIALGSVVLPVVAGAFKGLISIFEKAEDPAVELLNTLNQMKGVHRVNVETAQAIANITTLNDEIEELRESTSKTFYIKLKYQRVDERRSHLEGPQPGDYKLIDPQEVKKEALRRQGAVPRGAKAKATWEYEMEVYGEELETITALANAAQEEVTRLTIAGSKVDFDIANGNLRSISKDQTIIVQRMQEIERLAGAQKNSRTEIARLHPVSLDQVAADDAVLQMIRDRTKARVEEAERIAQSGKLEWEQYVTHRTAVDDLNAKQMEDLEDNPRLKAEILKVYAEEMADLRTLMGLNQEYYDEHVERQSELMSKIKSADEAAMRLQSTLRMEGTEEYLQPILRDVQRLESVYEDASRTIADFQEIAGHEFDPKIKPSDRMDGGNYANWQRTIEIQKQASEQLAKRKKDLKDTEDAMNLMMASFQRFEEGMTPRVMEVPVELAGMDSDALATAVNEITSRFQMELSDRRNALELKIDNTVGREEKAALKEKLTALEDEAYRGLLAMAEQLKGKFKFSEAAQKILGTNARQIGAPTPDVDAWVDKFITDFETAAQDKEIAFSLNPDQFSIDNMEALAAAEARNMLVELEKYFEQNKDKFSPETMQKLASFIKGLRDIVSADDVKKSSELLTKLQGMSALVQGIRGVADAIGGIGKEAMAALSAVGGLLSGMEQIQAAKIARDKPDATDAEKYAAGIQSTTGALGIAAAGFGFVATLIQGQKERNRQHAEEMRRMAELANELRSNTLQLQKGVEANFQGGQNFANVSGSQLSSLAGLVRGAKEDVNKIRIEYDPNLFGVGARGGLEAPRGANQNDMEEDDRLRAIERMAGWFMQIEDLEIPGAENLVAMFRKLIEQSPHDLRGAFDKTMAFLQPYLDRANTQGAATADYKGALAFLTAFNRFGDVTDEQIDSVIGMIMNLDELGPVAASILQGFKDIDTSTEEGKKLFKEMWAKLALDILKNNPELEGMFELLSPEDWVAIFDAIGGSMESSAEALEDWVAKATGMLGIFTGLLGKEGMAAFQFFIDSLMASGEVKNNDLAQMLKMARGADLTTQEGQKQLDAIVERLALSILAGTTMGDFGLTDEQARQMAETLKSTGEAAYEDAYSASTSVQRTVTDIQGDEMLILLNEIAYWTKVTANGGASLGGEMPVSLESAIRSLTEAYTAAVAADATGAAISINNTFNIDLIVRQSVEDAMVEANKQVLARTYQSFPRA